MTDSLPAPVPWRSHVAVQEQKHGWWAMFRAWTKGMVRR